MVGITLKNISELYNYKNIKKYIKIYIDEKNDKSIEEFYIKKIIINGINYQLVSNKGTVTLAYNFLPENIKFIIIDNCILIKIHTKNNSIDTNSNLTFLNDNKVVKKVDKDDYTDDTKDDYTDDTILCDDDYSQKY
jgi:hypothetical protein